MKQQSILIGCYAALLIVGGMIGYFSAGSLASLVMSSAFALVLLGCSFFVWKGNDAAYHIAMGLVFVLLLFFGYRFFTSLKFVPAGLMLLLSLGLLIILSRSRALLRG